MTRDTNGMPREEDRFAEARRRVLVFSPDLLPYPDFPTVGSGLRAWGLGNGLAAHGHEVLFSMPRQALAAFGRPAPAEVEALAWRPLAMHEVVERTEPDVVVVCGWAVMENLAEDPLLDVPVVLDQHGPHMLERRYQGVGQPKDNSTQKRRALKAADFFSCAGERQLDYFQNWLRQAGWSAEERRERSAAMPFSLSPQLPEREPAEELTFVYGGVWLPWQDPSPGLLALVEQLNRRNRGVLQLFGGKHPWIEIDGGVFERLVVELEESPRVVHEGQVSHAELIHRYSEAHVAIDLMKRNPERELAFTSRTVEFLWCGLPVLYNDYSELSDLIRAYDAGWTVDPEQPERIAAALDEIFERPDLVARKSENAQRLVRERLSWDRSTKWLDNVVRVASVRPRRVAFPRAADATLLGRVRRLYRLEGPVAVVAKGARVVIGTDPRYGWLTHSRVRAAHQGSRGTSPTEEDAV
jgi:glycosyl transferase family 1